MSIDFFFFSSRRRHTILTCDWSSDVCSSDSGLCDEPFSLALLPLANQGGRTGCVIFDAANLEVCATIVWQLRTFLKVVHRSEERRVGKAWTVRCVAEPLG